jgi:hypothetical protein
MLDKNTFQFSCTLFIAMKRLHKFAVYFFNFGGVLSLKIKGERIETSRIPALVHSFFYFFCCICLRLIGFATVHASLNLKTVRFVNISLVLTTTTFFISHLLYLLTFLMMVHQYYKRKTVLKFFQSLKKLMNILEIDFKSKHFQSYETKCLIIFIVITALVNVSFVQALLTLIYPDKVLQGIFILILYHWNSHIFLYSALLTFLVLQFFICALQKLEDDFKIAAELRRKFYFEAFVAKLKLISKLLMEFYEIFAPTLSVTVVYLIFYAIFRVNRSTLQDE